VKTIITSLFLTILLLSAAGIVFGQDADGEVHYHETGDAIRLAQEVVNLVWMSSAHMAATAL
jgi:hypothetical protein